MEGSAVVSTRPSPPTARPDAQLISAPREPAPSFEQSLRELVRSSPYVGASLALHALVLLLLVIQEVPLPQPDPEQASIRATLPDTAELVPPEPPPPPPPLVPPESVPEVTDVLAALDDLDALPSDIPSDLPSDRPSDAPFDDTTALNLIGLGGGSVGRPPGSSKLSRRGAGGMPHARQIDAALDWLARHQHPDGHWSGEGFQDECSPDDELCSGRGSVHHDVGLTGLSLLAFLGAGHSDRRGPHADTVRRGIRWLTEVQDQEGRYAANEVSTATYDHFLATLAMIEASALGQRSQTRRSALAALGWAERQRNPGGAWRYLRPSDPEMLEAPDDVSVTGWAVMALSLAADQGLPVSQDALLDALLLVDELTDERGRTGYVQRGGGSSRPLGRGETFPAHQTEAMTAVGLLCRLFIDPGLQRDDLDSAGDAERAVELLLELPIVWDQRRSPGRIDFYYWYSATYALFQYGGEAWRRWQPGLDVVAAHQETLGARRGSWDPAPDVWGAEGGRIYSTAMLTLLLEVYSRYDVSLQTQRGRRRAR
ncbi:MAG: hypothetical protein DRQ55_04930 [Planctomycetota bacterium]|nr:MAG: hypothetical protein DRQ55_04930 [Planctomycetota bacterium]